MSIEPVLGKFQKHFDSNGLSTSLVEKKLDFEMDYLDSSSLGNTNGIGNVGTLRIFDSPIDYVNIIKKQECVKCNFASGGFAGMGVHLHSWWKVRFFLSFPEYIKLGPFGIGTISTIKKGLLKSKLESFEWSGYPKLTTLPPGLIRDNVAEVLFTEQLKKLIKESLLNERTIFISRYSPPKEKRGLPTGSKIIIHSSWKLQKELFLNKSTIEMYEKIAEEVKKTINELKYHLW